MLDPSVLTLRDLARQVIESGFEHAVAASHCVTLGMQTSAVQAAVSAEVAEAGIAVITLPQTNLFLQGRDDPTATPRGLTAIAALTGAGVTVAGGGDNVQDPFNLVGRSDPLETAALLVMAGHRLPDDAYARVADHSRIALGLEPVAGQDGELRVGAACRSRCHRCPLDQGRNRRRTDGAASVSSRSAGCVRRSANGRSSPLISYRCRGGLRIDLGDHPRWCGHGDHEPSGRAQRHHPDDARRAQRGRPTTSAPTIPPPSSCSPGPVARSAPESI